MGGDGTSVAVFKDSSGGPFYADPLKYAGDSLLSRLRGGDHALF